MYLLEDRILFDGAAAADVAAAIAEAEAQQEQQEQEDAEQQEQDQQQQTQDSSNDSDDSSSSSDEPTFITDIDALIADAMNSAQQDVRVLVVSQDILDSEGLMDAAADSTIVITYDPNSTSLSDLLAQIKDSLGEDKADSIAFAVKSTENGDVILSTSSVTSLDSLASDADQQAFWEDLGTILKSEGRVDLLSSDLASTEYGMGLIDSISDLCDADVAASDNTTGADGDWILETDSIDLVDLYFDGEKIDAYTDNITIAPNTIENSRDLVIINNAINDYQFIADQVGDNADILYIEGFDALDQINSYLAEHEGVYDSIHLMVHGGDGHFYLGSQRVDGDTISALSGEFAEMGQGLTADGDIFIYGCELAASENGRALVNIIAGITGADIAASDDITGIAGDWHLEYTVGTIQCAGYVLDYNYNLKNITVNDVTMDVNPIASKITLREAIEELNALEGGGTITFANADTLKGTTVRLDSGVDYGELVISNAITINGQISLGDDKYTYVTITRADASFDTSNLDNDALYTFYYGIVSDNRITEVNDRIANYGVGADFDDVTNPVDQTYITGNLNEASSAAQTADSRFDSAITEATALLADALATYNAMPAGTNKDLALIAYNNALASYNTLLNYQTNFDTAAVALAGIGTLANADYSDNVDNGKLSDVRVNSEAINDNTTDAYNEVGDFKDYINEVQTYADREGVGSKFRLVRVTDNAVVTILNTRFNAGYVNESVDVGKGNGGGIYNTGNLTLINVNVANSYATGNGGGIYNAGELTINLEPSRYAKSDEAYCSVRYNEAAISGGGIFNATGKVTITGEGVNNSVTISGNKAAGGSGGGFYTETSIDLTYTSVSGNSAVAGDGGGGYIKDATDNSYFLRVDFNHNTAAGDGGGLYTNNMSGDLKIRYSFISNNTASGNGGGIYMVDSGNLIITGQYTDSTINGVLQPTVLGTSWDYSSVSSNTASGSGGGIYMVNSGNMTLDFVKLISNTAALNGGGIYMSNSGNVLIYDSQFESNGATNGDGGAFYWNPTSAAATFTMYTSAVISNNTSNSGDGGGFYFTKGNFTVENSTFAYNTANSGNGGAIYTDSGNVKMTFCTVAYNKSTGGGDGNAFYFNNTTISLTNNIIYNTGGYQTGIHHYVFAGSSTVSYAGYNIVSYNDATGGYDFSSGTGNIVSANANFAGGQLYLDTELMYHANYKTKCLAITNEASIAFAGTAISAISYDQRGNYRYATSGQSGRDNKAKVAIGAFDPIFYLVVDTKADDSSVLNSTDISLYSNKALGDKVTLREAIYWIDNYEPGTEYSVTDNDRRYISFDTNVFKLKAGEDNTIHLQSYNGGSNTSQIEVGFYRKILSGKQIVIDAPDTLQTDSYRITVDGGNLYRVFSITSGHVTINNLTVENGSVANTTSVWNSNDVSCGGGIIITGGAYTTVYLNNVLVTDCKATGTKGSGGFGGGIYNAGYLYMTDSTITEC
ncbi:MAG: DUF4347 domain-containing protein, partial [Victivallales bacterium]|nr:DUF4347 domain-containing protein [Victivallales bacterium]